MARFDWDKVGREDRLRRHGGEPVNDGSPNQMPPPADLSTLESLAESYIRVGVRGTNLVAVLSNSTGLSHETVAQWIQQRYPTESFYERNRRKRR